MRSITNTFILSLLIFGLVLSTSQAQSVVEVDEPINVTDENNLKQGFWKVFGRMRNIPEYEPDQVIEKGNYENSQKKGLWTKFFANGKTKNEIEYVRGRQNGAYKTYYDNGELQEKGNWKNNRNTGEFLRKHKNGKKAQEFMFASTGKRKGQQLTYNDEGVLIIDALIEDGKKVKILEYYDDGSPKAEKNFKDGKLDATNTRKFPPKKPIKEKVEGEIRYVGLSPDEKPNPIKGIEKFSGEGQHKIYNMNKQISKDGFFKNYQLIDGLWYKYNIDGILVGVERYKKGRYIGDAPLPKD